MPVLSTTATTLPTRLGWMGLIERGSVLVQLSFGHPSAAAALAALDEALCDDAAFGQQDNPLVHRLQAFANGERDDFRDVAIDEGHLTAFSRRVVRACRRVPYGKTISYAELAQRAGSAGAARAVGSVMRKNRFPLIVPCHRIVASGSGLGGYSAPGGLRVKRELLELEAQGAGQRFRIPRSAVAIHV